jgi:trimeric autotransporter adhesin
MGVCCLPRRAVAVLAVVVVSAVCFAGQAFASSVSLCVSSTAGQPVTSGACSSGGTTVKLPASAADQNTLLSVLPHMSFVSSGVGGKPTIRFSGVNVQIVSGSGATNGTVNGEGNLVLGYDENPSNLAQSGSHDLILGRNQSFKGYGELVGGYQNVASGAYATVFGVGNNVSASYSAVTGGNANAAKGTAASVTGGYKNTAAGSYTSITGGCSNLAGSGTVSINSLCTDTTTYPNSFASITGGASNQASATGSSVTGGQFNHASDPLASITGGCRNLAGTGTVPSPSCASGLESITGGAGNNASGDKASISGGQSNFATGAYGWVGGGLGNTGGQYLASVVGGEYNTASGIAASILGGYGNSVSTNCGTFPNTGQSC